MLGCLNALTRQFSRTPFTGLGKPAPLRGDLSGWWSRRLSEEHSLMYRVTEDTLIIAQCRRHC